MASAEAILAKVTAQTDTLKAIAASVDALDEGQASISALIADLKAQIAAAGTPVDLGPLETAVDQQGEVIAGLSTAIPAGTSLDPSANG